MTVGRIAVLRPGDWVGFDGGEHQVVALAGTSVRLRSGDGLEQVVLCTHLMAAPGFAVIDGAPLPAIEPLGLLDGLRPAVVEEACDWERHLVEVETGLPPNPPDGAEPRVGFDPAVTTLAERARAKAAELGVSLRTVQNRRARYRGQGLWGLVDQRAARDSAATGRVDARLVAAIREVVGAETETSTGTRSRLIRRAIKTVEAAHGEGVVPLPGRTTFYKVIDAVASGRHTFGSAVTRRQMANRPAALFTPSFAARPGEQVQIDSTPIDVLVLLDNGVPVRADLTIAVDVATRTICAAVLRPVGTKAVDAALLLARMLVPEPMRPDWAQSLRMSASVLPHARLLDIDARMELAAARPVIVPDTIVIDHGKVFVSDTFTRACDRLGVSVQPARPGTPTDKPIVEATFDSINSLFCQHVASYTGSNTTLRGVDATGAWTLPELQDLLDEWLLAGWQPRPHDALRDPLQPKRVLSPNEKYADRALDEVRQLAAAEPSGHDLPGNARTWRDTLAHHQQTELGTAGPQRHMVRRQPPRRQRDPAPPPRPACASSRLGAGNGRHHRHHLGQPDGNSSREGDRSEPLRPTSAQSPIPCLPPLRFRHRLETAGGQEPRPIGAGGVWMRPVDNAGERIHTLLLPSGSAGRRAEEGTPWQDA